MKSTGSVVTYLIFEFSFQHVLFTRIREHSTYTVYDKKLSYCWETVRRESMPRIAEMDLEMTI